MEEDKYGEVLARVDERVGEIHKWAFGNGQPGAAGRLVTLETQMVELRKPKTWPAVISAICAVIAAITAITLTH